MEPLIHTTLFFGLHKTHKGRESEIPLIREAYAFGQGYGQVEE